MIFIEVGDLHVKKDNIEESRKFIVWLKKLYLEKQKSSAKPIKLIFLGDQFNDFGVARVEVVEFWVWATMYLNSDIPSNNIIYLVGNHDRNAEGTDSAMWAFQNNGLIVDKQEEIIGDKVAALGFIRDNKYFIEKVQLLVKNYGIKLIYCHAEFQGAQFESGSYAPHGIDLNQIPQGVMFRSGHFHKKQQFGPVKYVGTPRHLTKSDIGETKGIHIIEFFDTVVKEEFIPTPADVCEPFVEITINEGEKIPKVEFTSKTYVNLVGSKQWCEKMERKIPGGTKTYCTYTDVVKEIKVKESDGIAVSFNKFYAEQNIKPEIKDEVLKRILEACPNLR
jgi:DNA repair exonuclease SbcCD nuclease subunit